MQQNMRTTIVAAALIGGGLAFGAAAPSYATNVDAGQATNVQASSWQAKSPLAITHESATSGVYKFPVSDRLYRVTKDVVGRDKAHWLTGAEWKSLGYPAPMVTNRVPGITYYGFPWTPEVIAHAGEPYPLKLAPSQYQRIGNPDTVFAGVVYSKAPNGDMIVAKDEGADAPIHFVTFNEWDREGRISPNITDLSSFVYQQPGTPHLYVWKQNDGCGEPYQLSFAEWMKMGQPRAEVKIAPWDRPCYGQ